MYSGDIASEQIADNVLEFGINDTEEDDDNDKKVKASWVGKNAIAPQNLLFAAMEIRKMLNESKGVDGWLPDSSDLNEHLNQFQLYCSTSLLGH